jgi:sulfite reductase (NADPH) hemoprotein beta-component
VIAAHDIGLRMVRNAPASRGSRCWSAAASAARRWSWLVVREFLPEADLLPYVEAVLSVYNVLGRRDNKYKARIKITLRETGEDALPT